MGLRDHPRISAATRRRIRTAAARLGYRPDPAISHLMSYMRKRLKPTPASALAYLTDRYPDDWMNGHLGAVYQGAKTRAAALGYHLEMLSLKKPGTTDRHLPEIIRARGIEGVLIGPLVNKGERLNLDCSDLSTVVLSGNIWQPPLHRVHSDYHFNMLSMLRRLTQLGYRRVGLVTNAIGAHHIEHQEEGAFLAATQRLKRQLGRWRKSRQMDWEMRKGSGFRVRGSGRIFPEP